MKNSDNCYKGEKPNDAKKIRTAKKKRDKNKGGQMEIWRTDPGYESLNGVVIFKVKTGIRVPRSIGSDPVMCSARFQRLLNATEFLGACHLRERLNITTI